MSAMRAIAILDIYLCVFTAYLLCELVLVLLNLRALHRHAGAVPQFIAGRVDQETYDKASAYSVSRSRFSVILHLYRAALLGVLP